MSNKDECHGSKHPKDECYVFSSNLELKMSATVANTLGMNAIGSIQISIKDECHSSQRLRDKCNVFSSKWAIKMSASVANTLRMIIMCSNQYKQ